jgi:hypothetical protein
MLPAVVGLEQLDPAFDIDAVTQSPLKVSSRRALIGAAGFGGVNAALVLTYQALAEEVTPDAILDHVVATVPVPRLDLARVDAA